MVYRRLRGVAAENGLAWLLDELDEAASAGVIEVKALRPKTREGRITYEELSLTERAGPGRRRAEEFLSRRPMTILEQVDALLDALTRVLVVLDEVASAAITQLNGLPQRSPALEESSVASSVKPSSTEQPEPRTQIFEINFEPDEGSLAPRISTEVIRRDGVTSTAVGQILAEIRDMIRS